MLRTFQAFRYIICWQVISPLSHLSKTSNEIKCLTRICVLIFSNDLCNKVAIILICRGGSLFCISFTRLSLFFSFLHCIYFFPIRAIWHVVKRKRKINLEISRKSKDRSCNTNRLDNREAASKDLIVSCRNYTKRGAIYSRQTCRFSSSLQYCDQVFIRIWIYVVFPFFSSQYLIL